MKRIAKILLAVVCVVLAVCVISYVNRPYSSSVLAEKIQERGADRFDPILVKIDDGADGRYYEIKPSYDLGKLFAFDRWEQTKGRTYDTPVMEFRLAEQWILKLYGDGKMTAYDGYSSSKCKSTAYYTAPEEIIRAVSDFIEIHGEPQEKPFSESMFYQ